MSDVKYMWKDPTLNNFATANVVVNVNSGSLWFKSKDKLWKIEGDSYIFDESTNKYIVEPSGDHTTYYTQDVVNNNNIFTVSGSISASGDLFIEGTVTSTTTNEVTVNSIDITGDITGSTISASGDIIGNTIRLSSTSDATVSSTGHAFQSGLTDGTNVIINSNEIMARDDGSVSSLHLNPDGGRLSINNNNSAKVNIRDGNITASANISSSQTIIANEANIMGNITASGNISGSGDLTSNRLWLGWGGEFAASSGGSYDALQNFDMHIKSSIAEIELEGTVAAELNWHHSASDTGERRARWTLVDEKFKAQGLNDADDSVTNDFLCLDLSTGKVGIKSTDPKEQLHVEGNISASGKVYADEFECYPTTTDEGGQLTLRAAQGRDYKYNFDNYQDTARIFRENDTGGSGVVIATFESGKVNVTGNITASGNIKTTDLHVTDDVVIDDDLDVGGKLEISSSLNGKLKIVTTMNTSEYYIADFQNRSTNTNIDVLALRMADQTPGNASNFITFSKGAPSGNAGSFDTCDTIEGDDAGGVRFTGESAGTFSDMRNKQNIVYLEGDYNATNILKQIDILEYELKSERNPIKKRHIGFSAQQLLELYPYPVTTFDEENKNFTPEDSGFRFHKVNQGKLTPLIVKTIQEQQKIIEELKTEVEKLKNKWQK